MLADKNEVETLKDTVPSHLVLIHNTSLCEHTRVHIKETTNS